MLHALNAKCELYYLLRVLSASILGIVPLEIVASVFTVSIVVVVEVVDFNNVVDRALGARVATITDRPEFPALEGLFVG